jgi:hypothetical protein
MKIILGVFLLVVSQLALAGTNVVKVDLSKENPTIVRGDLDTHDVYYFMDTKACLCWIAPIPGTVANEPGVFDCKKLAAYQAFAKYTESCK